MTFTIKKIKGKARKKGKGQRQIIEGNWSFYFIRQRLHNSSTNICMRWKNLFSQVLYIFYYIALKFNLQVLRATVQAQPGCCDWRRGASPPLRPSGQPVSTQCWLSQTTRERPWGCPAGSTRSRSQTCPGGRPAEHLKTKSEG
jgi:hypothetical protein